MLFARADKMRLPTPEDALPGRAARPFPVPERHAVLGTPLEGPWPAGLEVVQLGSGCFWGAERTMWQLDGVYSTAVGYQGGFTPNPTYEEVCTGRTGHAEVVQVVFDPAVLPLREVLRVFWENHDPTQGFRQGNDIGSQYRSAVYVHSPEQRAEVEATRDAFQTALTGAGLGGITTEVADAAGLPFYYAEDYHQQYLHKVPHGYDCHAETGVRLPD